MTQGKRSDRMASLIKQELAGTINTQIRDPRVGFVTITHVEMSPDLKHARVFYSVLGDAKRKKEAAEGLNKARGFLQKDLGQKIMMRYVPHLTFINDPSLDESQKIDRIIQKIHEEDQPGE